MYSKKLLQYIDWPIISPFQIRKTPEAYFVVVVKMKPFVYILFEVMSYLIQQIWKNILCGK
jgi:hypothetical protein